MSIKIRNTEIGDGIPKICIPVTGTTRKEIEDQLEQIKDEPFDLLEWRVDFFEEMSNEQARTEMICEIREYLGEKPFLFTLRTKDEGGQKDGITVIGSNHDFEKTPSKDEIVSRLTTMKQHGADIPKIAVMPEDAGDVLTLLKATREFHLAFPEIPVITMSMGTDGMISRIAGEVIGSAVTFGSGVSASAPGQIPAKKLREILEILHEKRS